MRIRTRSRRGGWGAVVALVGLLAAAPAAVAQPLELPSLAPPVPPPAAPAEVAAPGATAPPAAAGAAPTSPSSAPATPSSAVPLKDYWKSGLRFESADKDFSLFVGGRVQFDVVGYMAPRGLRENIPGTSPLDPGVSFRRVRLDMGGTLYKNIEFYTQVDFANGFLATPDGSRLTNATYPTDLWVAFKDLPWVGNIKVGNQKPLYSF